MARPGMSAALLLAEGFMSAAREAGDVRTMREKVMALEDLMRDLPQAEFRVTNHFAERTYGRELFIPKGTVATGKIHKYSQLNVLVSGELSVLTERGIERVKPPFVVVSPAGTKRVVYAHEDSIWLTVHGTPETDVAKIESEFIAQSEQEYLAFAAKLIEVKP